jgi:hypothetical protein
MLKIVLASLALGFATNAVIKGVMIGDLTSAGVPVGLALVIAAILFDQVDALKIRMSVDDEERAAFTLRLR